MLRDGLYNFVEKVYWNHQDFGTLVALMLLTCIVLMMICIVITFICDLNPLPYFGGILVAIMIGFGISVQVVMYESEIIDAAPVQNYISEEHHLAGTGYAREQVGEGSGSGSALYYASEVKIENVSMLQYVRQDDDGGLTFHTWPMDEVKIYESDTQAPVERHHHSRKVLVNPFTGEEKYVDDQLDYVEITVPAGSVVRNYDLSVNSGN